MSESPRSHNASTVALAVVLTAGLGFIAFRGSDPSHPEAKPAPTHTTSAQPLGRCALRNAHIEGRTLLISVTYQGTGGSTPGFAAVDWDTGKSDTTDYEDYGLLTSLPYTDPGNHVVTATGTSTEHGDAVDITCQNQITVDATRAGVTIAS